MIYTNTKFFRQKAAPCISFPVTCTRPLPARTNKLCHHFLTIVYTISPCIAYPAAIKSFCVGLGSSNQSASFRYQSATGLQSAGWRFKLNSGGTISPEVVSATRRIGTSKVWSSFLFCGVRPLKGTPCIYIHASIKLVISRLMKKRLCVIVYHYIIMNAQLE